MFDGLALGGMFGFGEGFLAGTVPEEKLEEARMAKYGFNKATNPEEFFPSPPEMTTSRE